MKLFTLTELLRLTRIELCALLVEITNSLNDLPDGSPERHHALGNLHKIRWALARGAFSP